MPPTLREHKTRNMNQNKAWCSLNEELREKSEPEIEPEGLAESLDPKKANKRLKYQKASFHLRAKLIQMVDKEGLSIRQASKQLSMKYSTAKCIYKLFVEENRLGTTKVSKEALLNAKIENSEDEKDSVDTFPSNTTKKVKKSFDENSDHEITMTEKKPELKQAYQRPLETQQKIISSSMRQEPSADNLQCQIKIPIPLNYSKRPSNSLTQPMQNLLNGYLQCYISNGMVVLVPGHQNFGTKNSMCNAVSNISQLPSRAGFLNYQQGPLMMSPTSTEAASRHQE